MEKIIALIKEGIELYQYGSTPEIHIDMISEGKRLRTESRKIDGRCNVFVFFDETKLDNKTYVLNKLSELFYYLTIYDLLNNHNMNKDKIKYLANFCKKDFKNHFRFRYNRVA